MSNLHNIIEHAKQTPSKNALIILGGQDHTYSELIEQILQFKSQLTNLWGSSDRKVLIVTSDIFNYVCISLVLIETYTMVFEDHDLDLMAYERSLKKMDVNAIIVDEANHPIVGLAQSQHISVYCIKQSNQIISIHEFDSNNELACESIAYILKTSGTTAEPKTFRVSRKAYLARQEYLHYDDQTVFLHLAKISRVVVLTTVFRVWAKGGSVVLLKHVSYRDIVKYLSHNLVTYLSAPPALLASFSQWLSKENIHIRAGKGYLVSVGSIMDERIIDNITNRLNMIHVNSYGLTETGIIANTFQCHDSRGTVGLPRIPIKINEGEIWVSGDSVIKAYTDAKETDHTFHHEWFKTGDLGHINEKGYLVITGRIKELINRGGEKVNPFELEALISQHESIQEVVVFPYPLSAGFEGVGCALVRRGSKTLTLSELRAYLMNKIQPFQMPSLLVYLDQIPYDTMHKVKRNQFYEQIKDLVQ
jgi:oxalate---CoA ligase